jgi:hypothetical protein
MNTCGTCRFKGKNIERDNPETFEVEPTKFFLCERIKHVPSGVSKDDGAFVIDGSGYYAALCVDDDFGCKLWEPKEPTFINRNQELRP